MRFHLSCALVEFHKKIAVALLQKPALQEAGRTGRKAVSILRFSDSRRHKEAAR